MVDHVPTGSVYNVTAYFLTCVNLNIVLLLLVSNHKNEKPRQANTHNVNLYSIYLYTQFKNKVWQMPP